MGQTQRSSRGPGEADRRVRHVQDLRRSGGAVHGRHREPRVLHIAHSIVSIDRSLLLLLLLLLKIEDQQLLQLPRERAVSPPFLSTFSLLLRGSARAEEARAPPPDV